MNAAPLHRLAPTALVLTALLLATLATSACTAVGVVHGGVKAAGRAVSSTGDVVFDHDGDGK